jgi:polyhydroxyalkanoate synthase
LLTTLLDFTDTGILDVFIDENFVQVPRDADGQGRPAQGQDLAIHLQLPAPNDLVWNYVVGNYLKGETPPPFDLLYWNSDSTNLPGPFCWYLRNTYLKTTWSSPASSRCAARRWTWQGRHAGVHLRLARRPHRADGTAPTRPPRCSRARSASCMGASGHIAGVINPPAKGKRSHWTRPTASFPRRRPGFAGATEHARQLVDRLVGLAQGHAGKQVPRPRTYGKGTASTRPSSRRRAATSRPRPDPIAFRTEPMSRIPVSPVDQLPRSQTNISSHGRHRHRFAARTAVGKFGGSLANTPATELGAS